MRPSRGGAVPRSPALEGVTAGLSYASGLAALGAFAVASFRPNNLSDPYWLRLGGLRTDTFGFLSFVLATVTFGISDYLRLGRLTSQASPDRRGRWARAPCPFGSACRRSRSMAHIG